MMTEHKLTIEFDTNVTIGDLLEEKTLDVTSLKQEDMGSPVREHVNEIEALDQRAHELEQIAAFIKKNGVTKPTEEDFEPKSYSWGGKKKKVGGVERRGRPRTTYTKDVTFVLLNDGGAEYKRAGRGRAKKGEIRESFKLHHTNVEKVSEGTWTRTQLEDMAKKVS